jgi:anti-sigma factor RsiW
MTGDKSIDESALQAYLDGEVTQEEMAELERLLAEDPQAARDLAAYRLQLASLHRAYDPVLGAALPTAWHEHLDDRLNDPRDGHQSRHRLIQPKNRRWLAVAALILAFLLGSLAGWQGQSQFAERPGAENFARRALGAHSVYVVEKRHPVEVHAEEQAHLVAWLSKRIGQDLKATLMGGRLLADGNLPIAQFMYQNPMGQRVTLYLRRESDGGESAFRVIEEAGLTGFYWVDPPFAFAMIGDLPRADLLELCRLVYQQLGQDMT